MAANNDKTTKATNLGDVRLNPEQVLQGELSPGTRVGSYVIRQKIGSGGGGCVYAAEMPSSRLRVAVKVLLRWLSTSPRALARFQREAEVVKRIDHPNIVRVLEVGILDDGRPYIVMDLETETIETLMQRRGRLPPSEVLEILEPTCSALAAAHAAGVVHRDIKASNIAVGVNGGARVVKLLDFGIAKLLEPEPTMAGLTVKGTRLGTPETMAPEQILGESVDHRADIYSLGVLAFQMLSGSLPFVASNREDLERLLLQVPPPRLSGLAPVGFAVESVVDRCLAKKPEDRFSTVSEFIEGFRGAVDSAKPQPIEGGLEQDAVAILFGLRAVDPTTADDLEDDWVAWLDFAERTLDHAGFQLPLQTANRILAVRLLPDQPERDPQGRQSVLAVARDLARRLRCQQTRPGLDATVSLHVGKARVAGTADRPRIEGGSVTEIQDWRVVAELDGVRLTGEAAAELSSDI